MDSPVIVALDYPDERQVLELANTLSPESCRLKVGKELFTSCGPALVDKLQTKGFEIFLDLKFHDIPNTVAGAVRAAANLGVWMVNVHASGGRRMMEAAAEALVEFSAPPKLIAVTVLTSMSDEDLQELGYSQSAAERVDQLAGLAASSGMDGVVCSAKETQQLRLDRGPGFCLVTPGIRLSGDAAGDQRRVVTPSQAMANGSNYLVIGRSITAASEPTLALEKINRELSIIN
ncbi:MAG: orotidine-5'-phosphate decarboxylase [Halioglobus sp.]|jgi:orotidine-5'-phosphate decarboxylase